MNEINFDALRAEFPREAVSWRAQSMNKEGTKALALAYIDARDVMKRLDEVCKPENWRAEYHDSPKRTYCTLYLRINGEWIGKSDAAGDTQVEAEKGAVSDALKRAAVTWGVGRYLYDVATPWVECEHYMKGDKKVFSKFKRSPWESLGKPEAPKPPQLTEAEKVRAACKGWLDKLIAEINAGKLSGQGVADKYSAFKKVTTGSGINYYALANEKHPDVGTWLFDEVQALMVLANSKQKQDGEIN